MFFFLSHPFLLYPKKKKKLELFLDLSSHLLSLSFSSKIKSACRNFSLATPRTELVRGKKRVGRNEKKGPLQRTRRKWTLLFFVLIFLFPSLLLPLRKRFFNPFFSMSMSRAKKRVRRAASMFGTPERNTYIHLSPPKKICFCLAKNVSKMHLP